MVASASGAIFLEISKWVFAWYVGTAKDYEVLYGAIGGLIFFVLWVYYASMIFVFSATLGFVADRARMK